MKLWSLLAGASAAVICGLGTASASAQGQPQPAAAAPPIAAPEDHPYPGMIHLAVDATDLARAIFRVRETVPVAGPGPLTLLYPKWLPGNHSPTGPIDKLAGLVITANGQPVEWKRDPVDVYAFHVEVPAGVQALDLTFQFLSPVSGHEGRIVMTPAMLNVEWNTVALYPAGYFTRQIHIEPSVTLPDGFRLATALETAATSGGATTFKPTTFNTLVDSPLIAGRNYQSFDLDPGGPARVSLDVITDRPDELAVSPEQLAAHKALVQQAYKLFASHHYDHYDFLLSLSDKMGGAGLEHHQSSEDGTIPKYFADWDKTPAGRDLLSHEYTHSWNGKFRRPADLWTPNFNTPMRDSLLWVYEGQTQYWGFVLAARSGLWNRQQTLDAYADLAALYSTQAGRQWRPLADTTLDPIIASRQPIPWRNYQRSEDYYNEGLMLWLDADSLIRQKTNGQKSLDDFARAFFGINDGSFVTVTYTFDDVVKALNGVMPYDWAGFLHAHLDLSPKPPMDGITRGGYRLVYTDKPSDRDESSDGRRKQDSFAYSIGVIVNNKGRVMDVTWQGPAFKAGLTLGSEIIAVNGVEYDADELKDAITEAKADKAPIQLLIKNNDTYRTVSIPYHDGLRYPHLERVEGTPALLDALITAKK
jgi:predicted metalloprotease with PDZ domain